jgi:hypothetical protein
MTAPTKIWRLKTATGETSYHDEYLPDWYAGEDGAQYIRASAYQRMREALRDVIGDLDEYELRDMLDMDLDRGKEIIAIAYGDEK